MSRTPILSVIMPKIGVLDKTPAFAKINNTEAEYPLNSQANHFLVKKALARYVQDIAISAWEF